MARWRKRLFRGLTAALVVTLAGAGWLTYQVTHGPLLRRQVLEQLRSHFVGADVALGSARLRLLGGITIDNLTLYRRDDPARVPLLHVPTGVVYHDKEQLAQGRLALRKLKLTQPRLLIQHRAGGRCNLDGILGTVHPDVPIPVIEVDDGTVVVEIAAPPGQGPPAPPLRVEVRQFNLRAVNQPLPVLVIDATGESAAYGPLQLHADWQRVAGRLTADIDLSAVAVGPGLVRELGRFAPGLAESVEQVAGTGRLHLGLDYRPDATPAWGHRVRFELDHGRLVHRDLPLPLDDLNLAARCEDGVVTIDRLTATAGPAVVRLKAQVAGHSAPLAPRGRGVGGEGDRTSPTRATEGPAALAPPHLRPSPPEGRGEQEAPPPHTPHPYQLLATWLEPLRSLDLAVERLPVTPALFARLPAKFREYQEQFAPDGPLDLTCRLERTAANWVLRARLRPHGMAAAYHAFPYPLRGVRGTLDLTLAGDRPPRLDLDLTAEASERRPVAIRGTVEGDGPAFAYDIRADGVPIDEPLLNALPGKFREQTRAFHPRGHFDVVVRVERPAGAEQPHLRYLVKLRDAAACYDVFPCPLDHLTGTLDVALGGAAPRFEFADVRGGCAGGRVAISGSAVPTPEGNRVTLHLRGERIALDDTLAAAFARSPMKLGSVWTMFAPRGRFDFAADVTHLDRPGGRPDYDLTVTHAGAAIQPAFFPYLLTDLAGKFRLTPGRVEVRPFTAAHGLTRLSLGESVIGLSEGGYRAELHDLHAAALPLDGDLVRALPDALKAVVRALEPGGTLAVDCRDLVIDEPAGPPGTHRPPAIAWDGKVGFADAALKTGVPWEQMSGEIACRGTYRGALEAVAGHVFLGRATVFGQPLTNLHAAATIAPQQPNVLQLDHVKGELFGGTLGGQAHVAFGAGLQYSMYLTASNVRLEQAGRHNRFGADTRLSGAANAALWLTGNGNGPDELAGRGSLDVLDGKMYNLPLALDLLLKVPTLHVPDRTAFTEAHVGFEVRGRRVAVQRLDLLGDGVSLGGAGELNLDGTDMKMDFYATWGHVVELLPPGLRELPPRISKNLLRLRATGRLGGPYAVRPEPLPPLADPLRQVLERIGVRTK